MSDVQVAKIISEIQSLSPGQRNELLRLLSGIPTIINDINELSQLPFIPRIIGEAPSPRDRSKEYGWLEQHREEYARQWVALDGDKLVSSNTNCRLVIDEARQKGIPDALIVYVEPPDAQSLVIW